MAKRDWITNDFGWKLFSLILAAAFWIAIRHNIGEGPATPVTRFAALETITFTNLPVFAVSGSADVRNAQVSPNTVTVQLTGPSESMAMLDQTRIHATVNLTSIDAASGLPLPVEISTPPGAGIAVDRVDPPKISVTFAPATE